MAVYRRRIGERELSRFRRIAARPGLTEEQRAELRRRYVFGETSVKRRRSLAGRRSIRTAREIERFKNLASRFGVNTARYFARRATVSSAGKVFSARVSQRVKESSFIARTRGATFQEIVKSWPDMIDQRLEALLEDVTQQAFENVQARTAVLSGEAQLGWFVSRVNKFRRFIGNDQPHIRRLEHGWSRQPNTGNMVRSTFKRMPQWIEIAAKRLAV
jgi:hypothetical protein